MAVFDATALVQLLEAKAPAATNPATGEPVADASARVNHLVRTLEHEREKIVIPTPALSEILVHAGAASSSYLDRLHSSRWFRIVPFDERAAVELAAITQDALAAGDLRAGTDATRATLKFDRQIIAITCVEGEKTIYSDDAGMARFAQSRGVEVVRTYELPPPPATQTSLPLEGTSGLGCGNP